MWSHLNSATSTNMVGYFFYLFGAILCKALKEELLLILWPCNFNLLRSPPSCKKSYYIILMSLVLLDFRKISCLHTILSTTINWLWKLHVWLTPAIILLLCWVIFSNNIFSRLFIIYNKSFTKLTKSESWYGNLWWKSLRSSLEINSLCSRSANLELVCRSAAPARNVKF